MKRLLFIIPLVLLFLLNACGTGTVTVSKDQRAAVEQTQTAEAWTAVPTPTFNPNISTLVTWLNVDILTVGSLEATIDAKYSVTDITFPNLPSLTFRIDVNCICMNNAKCCIPERTFVAILDTMKRNYTTHRVEIASDISQMLVVCNDQGNSEIGAIAASWQNVKNYLTGDISGAQLGMHIIRTIAPTLVP